ncbi:MAG: hypothetical protein K8R21_14790 [Leptospira sp.]|nr:hypothetical protein [Leptospira sp.]
MNKIFYKIILITFTLFPFSDCRLNPDNANSLFGNSFTRLQILRCFLGQDGLFCPKIPVRGTILSSSKIPIAGVTFSFSVANGTQPVTASSDSSGNFSNAVGTRIFNVSVKSFSNVFIGSFGIKILDDNSLQLSNVSSGISVTAIMLQGGANLNVTVPENSFFSFFGSVAGTDKARQILQTVDGGYIVIGQSDTNIPSVGSLTPLNSISGNNDCLVVKLNSAGIVQWYTFLGGPGNDSCNAISQTSDDGYVLAGTASLGFSSLGSASSPLYMFSGSSSFDGLVIKLASTGSVQWFTFFGGSSAGNFVTSVLQTPDDGGYLIGGMANGNFTTFGSLVPVNQYSGGATFDQVLTKFSSSGTVKWFTFLGSSTGVDNLAAISQTSDGGYITTGDTNTAIANIGSITPIIQNTTATADLSVFKVNANGVLQWFTFLGSSSPDGGLGISGTSDGGAIVGGLARGNTGSFNGKSPVLPFSGSGTGDCMAVKLSSSGNVEWFTFIGVAGAANQCNSAIETGEKGYFLAGTGASINSLGGVSPLNTFAGGASDILLVKLTNVGAVQWFEFLGSVAGAEAGFSGIQTTDGGYAVTGYSDTAITSIYSQAPIVSFGGTFDYLFFKLKSTGKF